MRIARAAAVGCVLVVTMSTQAGAEPGPSGVDYTRTTTCATNSVNVKAVASASTSSGATFNQVASNGIVDLGTSANITFAAGVTKIATFFQHAAADATAFVLNDFSDTTGLTPIFPLSFTFSPYCPETTYQESGSSTYRTIAPTRVLDTRPESLRNYAGGKPAANSQVTVRTDLAISATATAVAVNITIVDATSAGYVQAFPTGNGVVGASSNLNAERAGQIIANAAVLPVGADKTITLYTQAGAHLLVDVMGYFDSATSTGRYVGKASPERVLDTRPDGPLKNYAGAKPAAGSIVSVSVGTVPGLTTPGTISAAVLNVTAADASGAGYVQVAAENALPIGDWSNLNVERAGQVLPNMVIAPVSFDGRISLYTQAGTHLIVDVIGVFSSDIAEFIPGGEFVPLTPERVLDTRLDSAVNWTISNGSGPGGKPAANSVVPVRFFNLPMTTKAVLLNVTGTEATQNGYVQAAALATLAAGQSSNLNLTAGQTIPNAAVVPVDTARSMGLYTQTGTHLIADIAGYFTAAPPTPPAPPTA